MSDAPHNAANELAMLSPFEFSEEDGQIFRQLSMSMRIVGIALLTWGILLTPRIFADGDMGALVMALCILTTGVWTILAAHRFRAIQQTQGDDIEHLMMAMRSVHHLYILIAGIIGVIVVWIVAALIITLIVSLA